MKSLNKTILSLAVFIAALYIPITALANSSWYWFGNVRPIYILPMIVVITIIIETVTTDHLGKVNKLWKTALFVISANLLSFACPYVVNAVWYTPPYTFDKVIKNTPSYTVTIVFLLMTLAIEMPVVYLALRKNSDSKKSLMISIISSNAITTLFAAAIERIICRGTYF